MESQNGPEPIEGEVPYDSNDLTHLESNEDSFSQPIETNSPNQIHTNPQHIIHIRSASADQDPFAAETFIPFCPASIVTSGPFSIILPENVSPSTVFVSPYGDNIIIYVPLSPAEYVKQNSG